MVMMHVWFMELRGRSWRICRQKPCETSFSPFRVFLFSRNSRDRVLGFNLVASLDWEGSAPWASPPIPSGWC